MSASTRVQALRHGPARPKRDGMDRTLRLYLHQPLLATARAGKLGVANHLAQALEDADWRLDILPLTEAAIRQSGESREWALFHMAKPPHDRALVLRLAYHYPFWKIESVAERWRWPVALERFRPGQVRRAAAEDFAARLQARVLAGPLPTRGDHVLIPLQGQILRQRSFQTMAPIQMVEAVAQTGRPCFATLHPRETYDTADHAALRDLAVRYPNLTIGGDTAALLRNCAFVAAMNSATAFDGYILDKPAVLFAQVDFHHIALNVADLGAEQALARAADHQPPFARYLDWFLRQQSLDMMADDRQARIITALRRGGLPL